MTESWIFAYTKCCASKHQQVFTFLIGVTNGPWRKPARNGLQADDKSMVAAGVAASRSERLLASQLQSTYYSFTVTQGAWRGNDTPINLFPSAIPICRNVQPSAIRIVTSESRSSHGANRRARRSTRGLSVNSA